VDQAGHSYACLPQLDANLTSPPLPTDCTDTTHTIITHFGNRPFTIDEFIPATAKTRPEPQKAFASPNGILAPQGLPGGCTRDLVHEFYQEQYQLNGGAQNRYVAGSSSAGTTMGVYDTKRLPIYTYMHQPKHPAYAIEDNFFQGAFGGSFLNHQWLIAAATPAFPNAPLALHSIIDANGMPVGYPFIVPTGAVLPKPLTVACPSPAAARVCGGYAVNTMRPPYPPSGTFGEPLTVPQAHPTIGDRLSHAHIDWAWYSGGWSNANGEVGGLGWANGATAGPCADADTAHGAVYPNCPNAVFQFHHQPFNYFARYAPRTIVRSRHLRDEVEFINLLKASTSSCQLKAVSFVKPLGQENEHPGYASVSRGGNHVAGELLTWLESSVCARDTMVVLTYDEFGGQWGSRAIPGQGNENGPHDVWGPGTPASPRSSSRRSCVGIG
jgi:phospholipase C